MRPIVFSIVLAILPGCNPDFTTNPPAIKQPTGACQAAQDNLVRLRCPDAEKFAGMCERSASRSVDLHPQCVAKVTSCAQVNDASRGCK